MALSVSDAFWDISGTQAARGSYVINLGYELAACFRVLTSTKRRTFHGFRRTFRRTQPGFRDH